MIRLKKGQIENLTAKHGTPLIIFDLSKIEENISRLKKELPNFNFFYSTKTNPESNIVNIISKKGLNYDAASIGEIEYLLKLGVSPKSILFTHPVKFSSEIIKARKLGIQFFTFDSIEELTLLEQYAPLGKYFLRILPKAHSKSFLNFLPSKDNSLYDYGERFGASEQEISQIMQKISEKKIPLVGISFHIGTQTMSAYPWRVNLTYVRQLLNKYKKNIPSLKIVNIGGGFPEQYGFSNQIDTNDIFQTIRSSINSYPKDIIFWAEPGRVLVASSAILVTKVVSNIKRKHHRWLYADTGVYHGLIEVLESGGKFNYKITSLKKGELSRFRVGGRTIDPDDIISKNVLLPQNLSQGDLLLIHDVGAYTTMFFSDYHFLKKPKVVFI